MEPVRLASVDGIALEAAVHEPAGGDRVGIVIQAHGLTADMDEDGMFVRLADRLANEGFAVLRFSFRGHGKSGGTQRGVTIAGEMLDLQAACELAFRDYPAPLSIVAASFGAVSASFSLSYLRDELTALVLWNPVLDLRRTFTDPELPWGLSNFGPVQQRSLSERGFLLVDGEFELGWVLFTEFRRYRPLECFEATRVPALVIHGDRDTYVSYDIARSAADRPGCTFHAVAGSEHGFDSREHEDEAIEATARWLVWQHTGRTL